MWFAIPSSQWTCTTYSLPVSRRTCVKTRRRAIAIKILLDASQIFAFLHMG
jgi:hypothetical protein